MTNGLIKLSAAAVALLAISGVYGAEIRGLDKANVVPNKYIVVYKQDALRQKNGVQRSAASMAGELQRSYGAVTERNFEHVFKGSVVVLDLAAAKRLANDPRVAFIEADGRVSVDATQNGATWGLDRIDQTSLPLNASYTYPNNAGAGIHAYIIDTGIRASHSEFSGRIGNGADTYVPVPTNPNPDDPDTIPYGTDDCHGHGTHVAATVAGTTWGVAKAATLHPVRVLGCMGSGEWSGVIAGMDWVRANHVKPAVVNMSLGGGAMASVDAAVANLTAAGVVTVVAAGNSSTDACGFSPARAPSAITVASTTNTDALSYFSNTGSCVDIRAPGSDITSAGISSNTASAVMSGTSMASPHVAGAAALYLAQNASATPAQVTTALVSNVGSNGVLNISFLNSGGGGGTPAAPTTLTATSGACYGDNWVRWGTSAGATYYQLWAARSSAFTSPYQHGSYTDTNTWEEFPKGTYLKVKACNSSGCSALSTVTAVSKYTNGCM